MADPKTIVIQLKHIQPGQQWSTRRGNPLRFMVWAGADQPLDGTLQLAVELHPQSASGGTMPLAAATVEMPTGESATVDFAADQMALDLGGMKAITLKVVVVRVDEGGDPDTVLTGSLIVEGNPSSTQIPPGGPVYLYATTGMLAAEVAARQALDNNVSGMTEELTGLSAEQESQGERITTAETSITGKAEAATVTALAEEVEGKASVTLANVIAQAVTEALLKSGCVSSRTLSDEVLLMLTGKFDPAKRKGPWTPSTNTPAIPAAAGHTGEWYEVLADGTATGNAAGIYKAGDCIVSDGATWLRSPAPPTVVPAGSLPITALADFKVVTNLTVTYKGEPVLLAYAVLVRGGTKCLVGWKPNGDPVPNPADAAMTAATAAQESADDVAEQVAAVLPLAEPGGIPVENVSGWSIVTDGVWIMEGAEKLYLPFAILNAAKTKVMLGVDLKGRRFPAAPPSSEATSYILYPQDGGGIGQLGRDSTGGAGTSLIQDGAVWSDLTHLKGDIWTGRSPRITGVPSIHRINVAARRVLPLGQKTLGHIGGKGQSLNLGTGSLPLLSTTPQHPGFNLMFSAGSQAGAGGVLLDGSTLTGFTDLVEAALAGNSRESPGSGFLNRFQARNLELLGSRIRLLYSNHARGGSGYTLIGPGTNSYLNGLTEITRAKALAEALGWAYVYLATIINHGEADEDARTPAATYLGYMQSLLATMIADVQGITGQLWVPPLIQSQCSSWTAYGHATPTAALGQLAAALADPRILLACPKYFLAYAGDGVHLLGAASRLLGEYISQAFEHYLYGAGPWLPLHATSATQGVNEVTVHYHVPAGDLVFDTALVSDPGRLGFELVGATITGDPVISGNSVIIPKTGGTATSVLYAHTGEAGAKAGPTTGARGCLHDTNPKTSIYTGARLFNWACHQAINF